jgi:chemotaxis protein MotB
MVSGHTDSQPIADAHYRSNWELSAERAVTVTEFLITAGLRPQNLSAAGFSQYVPIASNGSDKGRADNRRIELVIEPPSVGELPGLVSEVVTAAGAASAAPAASAPAPPAASVAR